MTVIQYILMGIGGVVVVWLVGFLIALVVLPPSQPSGFINPLRGVDRYVKAAFWPIAIFVRRGRRR